MPDAAHEAARWKAYARKHEDRNKRLHEELSQLRAQLDVATAENAGLRAHIIARAGQPATEQVDA